MTMLMMGLVLALEEEGVSMDMVVRMLEEGRRGEWVRMRQTTVLGSGGLSMLLVGH
jgi:hypothetical protein